MAPRRSSVTPASLIGVLLLVLIVVVTMVGIGIGFYLQRAGDLAYSATVAPIERVPAENTLALSPSTEIPPPPPLSPDLAQAPTTPQPPVSAAPTLDEPPPKPANLPTIEPSAGATAPAANAAIQVAALPPPSATPDETGASDHPAALGLPPTGSAEKTANSDGYWVEFGVFVGPGYAERLRYALSAVGVGADVVSTRTPNGRHLLRVRSRSLPDHAGAKALALKAEQALNITPLVHHTRSVPETAIAHGGNGPYWVQFGAFNHPEPAVKLKTVLKQKDVTATVIKTRGKSGKPLFLVRSRGIHDYVTAKATAQRADSMGKLGALIGRSPTHRPIELRHKHAMAHSGLTADGGSKNLKFQI